MRPLWASQARLFDPDLATPDPSHDVAKYNLVSCEKWSDFAKTTLVTATGASVRVCAGEKPGEPDLLYVSGTLPTIDADGGLFVPSGTRMSSTAAVASTTHSFYTWSDAPEPAVLNFMTSEVGAVGPGVAPHHATGLTYFWCGAAGYQPLTDDSYEKLRGYSVVAGTAIAFGATQSQLSIGSANAPNIEIGKDATYPHDHKIRSVILRDVADDQAMQNAYKRHVHRQVRPVNPAWPKRYIKVCMHYEGKDDLSVGGARHNAQVLMRARVPFLRATHFLSAAYELVKGDSFATVVANLAALVVPGRDHVGLHIHWLDALATLAGVTIQDHHTLSGAGVPSGDGGYNRLASAYTSVADHRAFIDLCADTVEAYGYGRPVEFVCGNYLNTDPLLQALVEEGFTMDFSAIPSSLVTTPPYAAYQAGELAARWPSLTTTSQAYAISTPSGPITQGVINCGMTSNDLAADILTNMQAMPDGDTAFVHCHENDISGLSDLGDILVANERWCHANGKTFVYLTGAETS